MLRYDSLSRLNLAWTSSNSCSTNPNTAGSNATVSGPEPFWQTWTFDSLGDIATQVNHAPPARPAGTRPTPITTRRPTTRTRVILDLRVEHGVGGLPTVSYAYNANGSTKTLGGQSLTWTPNGQLASAGTTAAPTSYIYDADGNLLVQNDTSGTPRPPRCTCRMSS